MLRVGLVGVGSISGKHIPAWQSIADAELVALCSRRPEAMEKYDGVRKYADFNEMLRCEQLDILDICLPTFLHAEYAIKAMEKGIHVVCEKPISLHKADVARIYGAARKHNVQFMVAQVLRFWPEYEYLRELYQKGTYGRILSGNMTRLNRFPSRTGGHWMADEHLSGLVPFDLHIHDLDFMVRTFGAPKGFTPRRSRQPGQDHLCVLYDFDGFSVSAEAGWYAAPYPFRASFRFQFEDALVVQENGSLTVYERCGRVFQPISEAGEKTAGIDLPRTNAYERQLAYFADCVRNGHPIDKIHPEELETVLDILLQLS